MRAVYLVRHGQPEKPDVRHLCVGRLDLPLSSEGKRQAGALGRYFRPLFYNAPAKAVSYKESRDQCCGNLPDIAKTEILARTDHISSDPYVKVISSPLERCRKTAAAISPSYAVMEDFLEVDMGEWTGRSFDDIKRIWPDIYEARGRDMINTAPPGGESLMQCQMRALKGFENVLADYPCSDLIIAAHGGLIRMLVSGLSGNAPEDAPLTGSIIRLLIDDDADPDKRICLTASAKMPEELPAIIPDESTCLELHKEAGSPPAVIAHCRAVADMALKICRSLENTGINLNAPLVYAGAMLHDIMKGRKHHAATGAKWLFEKGYASVAAVVGDHMFPVMGAEALINEKTAVFLADKLIKETSRVTLEERYLTDPAPEKKPYAKAHYEQAKRLLETYKKHINI